MKRTAALPATMQESETGEPSATLLQTMLQAIALLQRLLKSFNTNSNPNTDALDTKKDLSLFLRGSVRQIENLAKAGKIPPPIYISDSSPRWRRSEVVAWLDKLAAESSAVGEG